MTAPAFQLNADDRALWNAGLDSFVPHRVFDAHTHVWSESFMPAGIPKVNDWRDADTAFADLRGIAAELLPDREVHILALPMPLRSVDTDGLNAWTAAEVAADPRSYAAALVMPDTDPAALAALIDTRHNIVALKPYYGLVERRHPHIADYLPATAMEIADTRALAVILHLPSGLLPQVDELHALAARYPRIRWVLAHCAGSFNPSGLEDGLRRLRGLDRLWLDTALIRDPRTITIALRGMGRNRIMFGTDNAIGIGGCRRICSNGRDVCSAYLQIAALQEGCRLAGITGHEVDGIFATNAFALIGSLRR